MEVHLDHLNHQNVIKAYTDHSILIGEQEYQQSLLLTANEIIHPWPPTRIAELTEAHCQELLQYQPQVVLIGIDNPTAIALGKHHVFFAQARVGLEIMSISAACRTFNVLLSEERRVAAGFIFENR